MNTFRCAGSISKNFGRHNGEGFVTIGEAFFLTGDNFPLIIVSSRHRFEGILPAIECNKVKNLYSVGMPTPIHKKLWTIQKLRHQKLPTCLLLYFDFMN